MVTGLYDAKPRPLHCIPRKLHVNLSFSETLNSEHYPFYLFLRGNLSEYVSIWAHISTNLALQISSQLNST